MAIEVTKPQEAKDESTLQTETESARMSPSFTLSDLISDIL